MTPQLRSRANLTARGYLIATVESTKRFPDKKKHRCRACGHVPLIQIKADLWGVFDLIAEHPQKRERVYVQVTDYTSHAKRRNKILASFETKLVLLAGARVLVQSWRNDGRTKRFVLREEEITLHDFAGAEHYPTTVVELQEIRRKEKRPDLPAGSTLPLKGTEDFDKLPF